MLVGVLVEVTVLVGTGVLEGAGVFEGMVVLVGTGVFEGAGVLVGVAVNVAVGVGAWAVWVCFPGGTLRVAVGVCDGVEVNTEVDVDVDEGKSVGEAKTDVAEGVNVGNTEVGIRTVGVGVLETNGSGVLVGVLDAKRLIELVSVGVNSDVADGVELGVPGRGVLTGVSVACGVLVGIGVRKAELISAI